jgi:multidrug efflux pump
MAIAMMGGLASATVLTIFFVPAMYAAWFRIRRVAPQPGPTASEADAPVPAASH